MGPERLDKLLKQFQTSKPANPDLIEVFEREAGISQSPARLAKRQNPLQSVLDGGHIIRAYFSVPPLQAVL
jgi:hypothetical protein